jgi:hypothetical protein
MGIKPTRKVFTKRASKKLKGRTSDVRRPVLPPFKPTMINWMRGAVYREHVGVRSQDSRSFGLALRDAMRKHGDGVEELHAAVAPKREVTRRSLKAWVSGAATPRFHRCLDVLKRIEKRYGLPQGHLKNRLLGDQLGLLKQAAAAVSDPERRLLKWHAPQNFDQLPMAKQKEILDWINANVLTCTTEYTKYIKWTTHHNFGLHFVGLEEGSYRAGIEGKKRLSKRTAKQNIRRNRDAPEALTEEVRSYVAYKTALRPPIGYRRLRRWNDATAILRIKSFKTVFGALSASPRLPLAGYGIPLNALSFGMLVFPAVWDWLFAWRETRRGFVTAWEFGLAHELGALTRRNTGWLRQNPQLAARLTPIEALVSQDDITKARLSWDRQCDETYVYAKDKAKELLYSRRVHRNPFEPILPIVNAESPLGEYKKILDEILRRAPDERRFPVAAAETMRLYLLLRLGLHMGTRQRNLRDLFLCPRGQRPRTERELEEAGHGEIRWNQRKRGWEIFIPGTVFKNIGSNFFQHGSYQLLLLNLTNLYKHIDDYVTRHRPLLLGGFPDPGTFFVRTLRSTNIPASYTVASLYDTWKLAVQLYGIYNPYTRRGAIKGLLPHGPHCIRDVLATHVLKQTGSYRLAAYAIQTTPETVYKHYGRFVPQEKLAQAGEILNKIWRKSWSARASKKRSEKRHFLSDEPVRKRALLGRPGLR